VPLWGTHEIIKVLERGGSILLKYTKSLFKFVNFRMFIILSKRLAWFCIYVYITYSFKARCSIEFKGAVNKKYSAVRQISRIQYIYFYLSDFLDHRSLIILNFSWPTAHTTYSCSEIRCILHSAPHEDHEYVGINDL